MDSGDNAKVKTDTIIWSTATKILLTMVMNYTRVVKIKFHVHISFVV